VLADLYPRALTREQVAEKSGYSVISSSFKNALSKLRRLELVYGYDTMTASQEFLEASGQVHGRRGRDCPKGEVGGVDR